ncbi:class I SAM-dependent methyltransferase [Fulvivirga aurantia]|uniref:class I SAM-dependent methyltransferase n=1 Tax=Fulvivirga aurantia TaxID=2529383 RepID=UPI00162560D0|nr:class I SAM-dependent methyltransferase [Fulvivirga aurantia]
MDNLNNTAYYGKDLAFVHDQGHSQFAKKATKVIASLMGENPRAELLVDLGCGSGRLEQELAESPINIIGVDYSAAMIELAKQNSPETKFLVESIYDFQIPQCDIVCSIGECFNYLFANKGDLNELKDLISRIYNALRPQGYLVFDILTTEILQTSQINSKVIEQDLWTIFLSVNVEKNESILTRAITLFLKDGDHYRKSKEVHKQKLFKKKDIEEILIEVGFRVDKMDGYDDLPFRSGQVGFLCKKDGEC